MSPTTPDGPTRSGATARRIAAAAHLLFFRDGYEATTVRAIAAEAGANPTLVIRHFGSKEALFLEVMDLERAPAGTGAGDVRPDGEQGPADRPRRLSEALVGPTEGLGERLVRYVVEESRAGRSQLRDVFVALVRASDSAAVRLRLAAVTERTVVEPVAARLSGPEPQLRARLVAVQLAGLMSALWVVDDRALRDVDPDTLVSTYGRALQQLIRA